MSATDGRDPEIQNLIDRTAIRRVIDLYCRGVDRAEEKTLRSVYAPHALEEHGGFYGAASDFCNFALDFLQDVECTAHYITQSIIDVDGNSASAESYCIASSFGMPTAEGEKVNLAIGARYLDRLERINGEWKIIHRRVVFDWNSIMAGDCRWGLVPHDNSIKGARGSDDPLFHAQSEETL